MSLSIDDLLRRAVENKASTCTLKSAITRTFARWPPERHQRRSPRHPRRNAFHGVQHDDNRQKQKFKETAELDMALRRRRVAASAFNVFQQRATSAWSARHPHENSYTTS